MRPDPNENRLKALIDEIRRPYLRELIKNEGLDDVVIICLPLGMESAATPDGRDRVTQCHRCLGPIFCRAYIPEGATLWCMPCAKAELGEDGYEKRAQEELGHLIKTVRRRHSS